MRDKLFTDCYRNQSQFILVILTNGNVDLLKILNFFKAHPNYDVCFLTRSTCL